MKVPNTQKVKDKVKEASAEGLEAGMFTSKEDLGTGWQGLPKGLGDFKGAAYISYGLADACLAIVECQAGFEVGVGEALRPYIRLYRGTNESVAVSHFIAKADYMIESAQRFKEE